MNTLGRLERNHYLLGRNVKDQLLWLYTMGVLRKSKLTVLTIVLKQQLDVGVEKCDGIEGEVRKNLL